ncbi:hypothetical protein K461DRAFT_51992 [Myriangium duriaei CBS 260.36]|uniref:Uncharacterized protein n=1 Tax=Myriangium duriaei CBS 260.36 TaxID=1168546 RepID=A0A9P4MID8_9PEZI|nr:hypothetical protein K461DRAFT_51992 [Myriangium duriaei CBS 260.36]
MMVDQAGLGLASPPRHYDSFRHRAPTEFAINPSRSISPSPAVSQDYSRVAPSDAAGHTEDLPHPVKFNSQRSTAGAASPSSTLSVDPTSPEAQPQTKRKRLDKVYRSVIGGLQSGRRPKKIDSLAYDSPESSELFANNKPTPPRVHSHMSGAMAGPPSASPYSSAHNVDLKSRTTHKEYSKGAPIATMVNGHSRPSIDVADQPLHSRAFSASSSSIARAANAPSSMAAKTNGHSHVPKHDSLNVAGRFSPNQRHDALSAAKDSPSSHASKSFAQSHGYRGDKSKYVYSHNDMAPPHSTPALVFVETSVLSSRSS